MSTLLPDSILSNIPSIYNSFWNLLASPWNPSLSFADTKSEPSSKTASKTSCLVVWKPFSDFPLCFRRRVKHDHDELSDSHCRGPAGHRIPSILSSLPLSPLEKPFSCQVWLCKPVSNPSTWEIDFIGWGSSKSAWTKQQAPDSKNKNKIKRKTHLSLFHMLHRYCSLRLRQPFLCFTNIWPFLNFKSEFQGPFSEDPCQCYREAVSLTSNRYPSVPRLTDKKTSLFFKSVFYFSPHLPLWAITQSQGILIFNFCFHGVLHYP